MTHILDLQRLWSDYAGAELSLSSPSSIDPRQKVVSVIVVGINPDTTLLVRLYKLLAQPLVREVIIVIPEDSSLEAALEEFAKVHPRCQVVSSAVTTVTDSFLVGVQYASCQYILFLKGAFELPSNMVLKLFMTGIHKSHPWIVGVKPRISYRWHKKFGFLTKLYSLEQQSSIISPEVSLAGGGVHAFEIAEECFLISTKSFLELYEGRKLGSSLNFVFNLCMAIHLIGGSIYQIAGCELPLLDFRPLTFKEIIKHEWQIFRTQWYLYQKYVSKKTNFFYDYWQKAWLTGGFLVESFLSLFQHTKKLAFRKVSW